MCEQCRTKVRARFFSLTAYAIQHCPMCNNKSILPELPIFPIIVSLYDYSLWDTYIFIFYSQYITVTPSSNANSINKMTWYLFPCGLLFRNNIIIARNMVLFEFMQSSIPVFPTIYLPTKYNVLHYTT